MREFSVPPVITIGDNATLTDPVWDNAAVASDTGTEPAPMRARS